VHGRASKKSFNKLSNMDYKYIEQLLERYFQGETTLQEEQILKSFYTQGADEMPQGLRQYAPLFEVVNEKPELDEDFDQMVLSKTEDIPQVKARVVSLTERLRPLFGAAATVAILLTLGNAISQSMKNNNVWVDMDQYATNEVVSEGPAVAYGQVSDSLTLAKDEQQMVAPVDSLIGANLD